MLLLESFVHRHTLAEIISRWMVDRPQPGDVKLLKQIVNFNVYATRFWLDSLASSLLGEVNGTTPAGRAIVQKAGIKDYAVDHLSHTNPRIEEMCARFQRFPEDFYRETPVDGIIYIDNNKESQPLVGISRIKRFGRIAEKGSRRIVDFMLSRIRSNADVLAEERARSLGIPREQLLTPFVEQKAEFAHAERRLVKSIKRGTIQRELPLLGIPDIAGLKVIYEGEIDRFLAEILPRLPVRVLEVEQHTGNYRATNIRLTYEVPRELLMARPPKGHYLDVLAFRGFDVDAVGREYSEFLEGAESEVHLELIVSDFEQFLESEIGRSLHEERVIAQRANRDYSSFLAANIRYLMEYVLTLCRSPQTVELAELPIKLWVKYMRDTIDQALMRLYVEDALYFDRIESPTDRTMAISRERD